MNVACVLKSGGEYRPEHVYALKAGVEAHLPGARFICLSDVDLPGVERKPLLFDLPGWWSKQELFCPGTFGGRVLYLDLDTVIVGDLSSLADYDGERAVLQDFLSREMIGSGMMLWRAEAMRPVWDAFHADPQLAMRDHPRRMDRFILKHMGEADRIQDVLPGQVVSYKVHCVQGVPENARVVCFHGWPRPWQLPVEHSLRAGFACA